MKCLEKLTNEHPNVTQITAVYAGEVRLNLIIEQDSVEKIKSVLILDILSNTIVSPEFTTDNIRLNFLRPSVFVPV